ncbi:MAG: hypothetical protein ACR5LA_12895 [Wolbachia sp.]
MEVTLFSWLFHCFLIRNWGYSDDTICCKLTFTLWSCRYPERIHKFCWMPVSSTDMTPFISKVVLPVYLILPLR